MNICRIVLLAIIVINLTFAVIRLTFKRLIGKNIIKPSKISKIFYEDDENFINSWRKTQEKGILKYMIKNVIVQTIMVDMIGKIIILYREQRGTQFWYLAIGVIAGLMLTFIYWSDNQNRYNQLKEKRNIENSNINNDNKKN